MRRKTESTDANAVSSRSHAVMEVCVKKREVYGAKVSLCAIWVVNCMHWTPRLVHMKCHHMCSAGCLTRD